MKHTLIVPRIGDGGDVSGYRGHVVLQALAIHCSQVSRGEVSAQELRSNEDFKT